MTGETTSGRPFVFEPTPAVATSRGRSRYVDCAVCRQDNSVYLFHKTGVRFVRCRTCDLVYVNPVGGAGRNYFDLARFGQHDSTRDRSNYARDFDELLADVERSFRGVEGRSPTSVLLVGRWLDELAELPRAKELGLVIHRIDDEQFARLGEDGDVQWLQVPTSVDVVILDGVLEATGAPRAVLERVLQQVGANTWLAVVYANAQSIPAQLMRRYWPPFFDFKRAFFTTNNLVALMNDHGLALKQQFPVPTHVSAPYAIDRLLPANGVAHAVAKPLSAVTLPLRTGGRVALFKRSRVARGQSEKLSIVFPCFNEERYVAQVIEAILAKPLPVERELIIVESNSTDRTREIVKGFEGRPGVRLILEDQPRGKGHAVRTGLAAVTGTIILIQDADFEYDIDDYDALLAPILQHRTSFVLGSRSLGLDDWKVRRFEGTPAKRFLLNAAQVGFAKTFNVLYQQRTTDVNTMFKVFRTECLEGIELEGDRFELDIELVCKLVRNGYAPLEVPVNYVARGFAEGKKISFVKDALPSYWAFLKYRFSR